MNTKSMYVANEEDKTDLRNLAYNRPVEFKSQFEMDRDGQYSWVNKSRKAFAEQQIAEKKALYESLDNYHAKRVAEFRHDIAFSMTKPELTRIISDMVTHDQVMALKSGREEYCNTFNELEKAILSAEKRITYKPKTVASDDLLEKARDILRNKGVIRLEAMDGNKMEKVKFAFNIKSFAEISNAGYKMVVLA